MGLATVHAAVERWRAEIDVQSTPNMGTTFTVLFRSVTPATPHTQMGRSTAVRALEILIVEDDQIVSKVMQRVLSPPHSISIAATGREAFNKAETTQFDLAFIDLGLPDQPGDQIARHLKSQQPSLHTILTTGWAVEKSDPRCDPFDDLVLKPATPNQILAAVDSLLNK